MKKDCRTNWSGALFFFQETIRIKNKSKPLRPQLGKLRKISELITHEEYCEIEDMILRLGLPTQIPSKISSTMLMKHLGHDKKKISGKNRFNLLNKIGEAFISDQLENKYLKKLSKNFIS